MGRRIVVAGMAAVTSAALSVSCSDRSPIEASPSEATLTTFERATSYEGCGRSWDYLAYPSTVDLDPHELSLVEQAVVRDLIDAVVNRRSSLAGKTDTEVLGPRWEDMYVAYFEPVGQGWFLEPLNVDPLDLPKLNPWRGLDRTSGVVTSSLALEVELDAFDPSTGAFTVVLSAVVEAGASPSACVMNLFPN